VVCIDAHPLGLAWSPAAYRDAATAACSECDSFTPDLHLVHT
jgi:hypothetical protein